MDFAEAIKAHSAWKMKLQAYLFKPDHSLNIAVVGADDKCPLGQWLKGEGRKHTNLPEYSTLVSHHTHFHRAAASVIEKADHGQCVDEEVALGGEESVRCSIKCCGNRAYGYEGQGLTSLALMEFGSSFQSGDRECFVANHAERRRE